VTVLGEGDVIPFSLISCTFVPLLLLLLLLLLSLSSTSTTTATSSTTSASGTIPTFAILHHLIDGSHPSARSQHRVIEMMDTSWWW